MDEVQKPSTSQCYTQPSEPWSFYPYISHFQDSQTWRQRNHSWKMMILIYQTADHILTDINLRGTVILHEFSVSTESQNSAGQVVRTLALHSRVHGFESRVETIWPNWRFLCSVPAGIVPHVEPRTVSFHILPIYYPQIIQPSWSYKQMKYPITFSKSSLKSKTSKAILVTGRRVVRC
jgi:hypothetical protein